MNSRVWITGPVQSGKTQALIEQFCQVHLETSPKPTVQAQLPLVFAMNADNRSTLTQRLLQATAGQVSFRSTTPLGFFEEEVMLFWPLLLSKLPSILSDSTPLSVNHDLAADRSSYPNLQNLRSAAIAPVPIRLRPETELHHAMNLWGHACLERLNRLERFAWVRWARNLLDLIQLAGFSGVPLEQVGHRLSLERSRQTRQAGLSPFNNAPFNNAPFNNAQDWQPSDWDWLTQLLVNWRNWCLSQGIVTYGLVSEIFWRHLLPDPRYQDQLQQRLRSLYADDVENYPAIARDFFEVCHQLGISGTYTYNPTGSLRLGLGGDPQTLEELAVGADRVDLSTTASRPASVLQALTAEQAVQMIQTQTRAQLLRATAEAIVHLVQNEQVPPQNIAVIGPGLDSLARYALIEIIESHGIPVRSHKDQRSLNGSALVRALITLMALVYDGLGDFVDQDAIAEMLCVLTTYPVQSESRSSLTPIDPVRAALLADYCYRPDRQRPELLDYRTFERWDRLGANAAIAYTEIRHWIQQQRQPDLSLRQNPVLFLDLAIQRFVGQHLLRFDQLAVLQELLETNQHYWEVQQRLNHSSASARTTQNLLPTGTMSETSFDIDSDVDFEVDLMLEAIAEFIGLIQQGVNTANPAPAPTLGIDPPGVLLATAYQYRIARFSHPYHFWLDIGSPLWQQGNLIALWQFEALQRSLFQTARDAAQPADLDKTLTPASATARVAPTHLASSEEQLFQEQILDLLQRVKHRLYFCHSELSIAGHEQMGPLLAIAEEFSTYSALS